MDKRSSLAALIGAVMMVIFALGPLIWSGFSEVGFVSQDDLFFNLVMMLLSPTAGGFVAGLISKANPKCAGLLAGLGGGMALFTFWLVFSGVSKETVISGLVVVFVWMFLAWIGAGFNASRSHV